MICYKVYVNLFIIKFNFNQPLNINSLPPNLTHLSLGSCFNQPLIFGIFPLNLTYLNFGDKFNQPLLHGVLPPNLTNKTEFK